MAEPTTPKTEERKEPTSEMRIWYTEFVDERNALANDKNKLYLANMQLEKDVAEAVLQFGLAIGAINELLRKRKKEYEDAHAQIIEQYNERLEFLRLFKEHGQFNDYRWY